MNIIIIGAGNVGFETAKILAKENSILLVARHLPEYLKEFMDNQENVFFAQGDATSLNDMENIRNSKIVEEFGKVDALICTAGTSSICTPLDDFDGFRRCFDLNFFANIIPIKIFLGHMTTMKKGRIVVISASSGHHASKSLVAYAPSKWALENTCASLREEVRYPDISIDVVCPRTIKNKYSKVWTQNRGDSPEYVAKRISKIVINPKNSRHFIPRRYFIGRLLERLFPSILNKIYGLMRKGKRKKLYIRSKISSVLITGASSGLGKELAHCYSKTTKTLNLIDKDWNGLVKLQKELMKNSECKVNIARVDIGNYDDILNYTAGINHVDLIINNAAVRHVGNVQDVTIDAYKQNFDINFFGPVLLTAEFLKKKKQPNKIINVLSTTAIRGRKYHSPYSSAKSALWSWTRSLRRVYGNKIQVMEVIPSKMTMTNLGKSSVKPKNLLSTQNNNNKHKVPLQAKVNFLRVNNWTAEKAAKKIYDEEMRGREIVMIPPIRAKMFLICETLSNWLFCKLFGK